MNLVSGAAAETARDMTSLLRNTKGPSGLPRRRHAREDQIAALIDPLRGPTFYDHDARGRLIRERRPDAVVERAMDLVGNVYRTADGRDRRYGRGGRLEQSDTIRTEYDEDGKLVRRVEADGSTWNYRWNGSGMLRAVERPDGREVRFGYDAFSRRTKKETVRVDREGIEIVERETRFVWDGHVVVHELDSVVGRTDWFWEPGTFTPVAKERSGKRWTIASDHLGTPTEMYDEFGELVWKMQLDVFGVPRFEEGDAEDCPWRWPGQYEDRETGLSYNRWRYYDSATGRFVRKDPIGLAAGVRVFDYPIDPILESDPLGLQREGMLEAALGVLQNHDAQIREVFGSDVDVGIRGSMSTGVRFGASREAGHPVPFDPSDFDVDGFVVDPAMSVRRVDPTEATHPASIGLASFDRTRSACTSWL